jgi:hypothetical protein
MTLYQILLSDFSWHLLSTIGAILVAVECMKQFYNPIVKKLWLLESRINSCNELVVANRSLEIKVKNLETILKFEVDRLSDRLRNCEVKQEIAMLKLITSIVNSDYSSYVSYENGVRSIHL